MKLIPIFRGETDSHQVQYCLMHYCESVPFRRMDKALFQCETNVISTLRSSLTFLDRQVILCLIGSNREKPGMSVAPVTEQIVAESVQKDKFSQTESMIFRAKPQKLMEVLMG